MPPPKDEGRGNADCDYFESGPRLKAITLEDPIPAHPKLPWAQLRTVSYANLFPEDFATAISQLSHCSAMAELAFYRLYIPDEPGETHNFPSFIADLDVFNLTFRLLSYYGEETPVVAAFIGYLTLRRVRALHLATDNYPLPWPQYAFLAFISRSSLHETPNTLQITNIAISADELLEGLAAMPCLEELNISDSAHSIHWPNSNNPADVEFLTILLTYFVTLHGPQTVLPSFPVSTHSIAKRTCNSRMTSISASSHPAWARDAPTRDPSKLSCSAIRAVEI
ncbi:hypothetical protein FB451DRAFT_1169428 [Mycena latifolia]|nr:hypothetical protein FB451DRAFT_1169428 [Mycena latifolia]